MKYTETEVVFKEVPDEIALAINISGCPIHCPGCHSKELAEDIGDILDESTIDKLISKNSEITCIGFMGGGSNPREGVALAKYVRKKGMNIWVYTGYTFEELNKDQLKDIDVLVDGEFKDELKDNKAHWVGSTNQRVIDIPLTLRENKIIIRRT